MIVWQGNDLTRGTPETIEPTREAIAAWVNLVFSLTFGGAVRQAHIETDYVGYDQQRNEDQWRIRIDRKTVGYCNAEVLA